jgi:hypothetical protein
MDPNSGADLISLKQALRTRCSPSTDADHYARCNGLTVDSLLFDWDRLVGRDPALVSTRVDLDRGQLVETAQLQECLFRALIPTAEQWQVSATSLHMLQQVCSRPKQDEVADWVSQACFPETLRRESLRLAVPALRSDHGTDCRRLARQVKAFLKEPLPDHRLPLHPVDPDTGEGLAFPKIMAQRDNEQMTALAQESLEVTKDTLVYLMQCLKADVADRDRHECVSGMSPYQGASGGVADSNS